MRLIMILVSSICLCACGARVSVGDLADPGLVSVGGANSAGDSNVAGAAGGVDWTDPTTAPDCTASPQTSVMYATRAQLDTLLVRRWRRCIAPQIKGEDVGVEFTADGKFYALTFDASHEVVRQVGIDYGGDWVYYPSGSMIPDFPNQGALKAAEIYLGGAYTNAPQFTTDPVQMRVVFSPVEGIYVPLDP